MKRPTYILWIELKRFYVEESDQPVVVIRDGLVLDANSVACDRGIEEGLPLRQAKAVLKDGVFKNWESATHEDRRRSWLDLCVDFSGVIEPADQHTAWLDLSLHPNPVDVSERLIRVLTQKTGLRVSYGLAPSKWLSRLAAKHDDCGLAMRDPQTFLAPLSVNDLEPISPEQRERLSFLGYSKIGHVSQLHLPTLQAQFGESALTIHSAAVGRLAGKPTPSYPPLSITESIVFDGALETTEEIERACRDLATSIGERLSLQGLQSGKLQVKVEHEDGQIETLSRIFTRPLHNSKTVLPSLQALLAPALNKPIKAIRVSMPHLEKVRLFQPNLSVVAPIHEEKRMNAALQQVQKVFGSNSVRLGREIEIPRRVKVLREWKHATGWQ